MIPQIKKILYASDLSQNSMYAFRYAFNSAVQHDAKIIGLHVIEALPTTARALVEAQLGDQLREQSRKEAIARVKHRIEERLKWFCETELKDDPNAIDRLVATEVREGYPAEVILKMADELDCDIIIMGTHGKGVISNTFLGSVAARVLRRVRKPVFIIPLPEGETDITFHDG